MTRLKANATMKEVALRAGVSTATVSRAFSQPEKLSTMTRNRVQEAVISCGYSAQSLTQLADANIILVSANNPNDLIEAELIQAIKEAIAEYKYALLVIYDGDKYLNSGPLDRLTIGRAVCGIIQIGNTDRLAWLKRHNMAFLPQVYINCSRYTPYSIIIDVDHVTAAFKAVNHLCQRGHTRIAYIGGDKRDPLCHYHRQGYCQALQRSKIAYERHYVMCEEISFDHGKNAVKRLMSLPSPPEAIYCHHDMLAVGAIYQSKRLGLSIPHNVSIISFGDSEIAKFQDPAITSVAYPAQRVGKRSVKILDDWINHPDIRPKSHLFETEIVQRNTTIKQQD